MIDDYYLQTSTPITYPVTLAEVKLWCKISGSSEDALLNSLITAATEKAEKITNLVFITRTYTGHFSSLDCSKYEKGYFIAVRRAPVSAVATVSVYVDDVLTTVTATDYNLKQTGAFPRIVFEEVNESPDYIPYPYQVAFTAGYGATADVPESIKTDIKKIINYWYRNRGDCSQPSDIADSQLDNLFACRIVNTFGC